MGPNKLQPALLGGAVLGVLSALPFINFANCCCIWFIIMPAVARPMPRSIPGDMRPPGCVIAFAMLNCWNAPMFGAGPSVAEPSAPIDDR